jgi:hypothetical protein
LKKSPNTTSTYAYDSSKNAMMKVSAPIQMLLVELYNNCIKNNKLEKLKLVIGRVAGIYIMMARQK